MVYVAAFEVLLKKEKLTQWKMRYKIFVSTTRLHLDPIRYPLKIVKVVSALNLLKRVDLQEYFMLISNSEHVLFL